MSTKNMEMMKKLIEEKKKQPTTRFNANPSKKTGGSQKAFNNKKSGGSLNK